MYLPTYFIYNKVLELSTLLCSVANYTSISRENKVGRQYFSVRVLVYQLLEWRIKTGKTRALQMPSSVYYDEHVVKKSYFLLSIKQVFLLVFSWFVLLEEALKRSEKFLNLFKNKYMPIIPAYEEAMLALCGSIGGGGICAAC